MRRLLALSLAVALSGCASGYGITTSRMALNNEPLVPLPPKVYQYAKPAVRLIALHGPRDAEFMRFHSEVPFDYDMRPEGYFLPLMEMDVTSPRARVWYRTVFEGEQIESLFNTVVTFLVWEGDMETGYELARFVGYKDKESFYRQVHLVIDMYYLKDPRKRKRHQ